MKKRFSDEQIISILREAEAGVSARELCRKHAISDATFYIYGLPLFCKHLIRFRLLLTSIRHQEYTCAQMGNPHTVASTLGRPQGTV
jgi:putative transposase